MPQSLTCLNYHLIFSTKNRAAMIVPDLRPRLYEYMGGIVRQHDGRLLAAGGVADHVHLLVSLPPRYSPSEVLRDVKACSSKWIHETFPSMGGFGWQDGYGAFTVSQSNIPAASEYTQQQEQHHQRQTFQEEFLAFLDRHQIAYAPKYPWT